MMDILKILNESANSIYPEDLDFFEDELATGEGYDAAYVAACMAKIKELRAWQQGEDPKGKDEKPDPKHKSKPSGLIIDLPDLAPKDSNPAVASVSPTELIFQEINAMREDSAYKTNFKKFVAAKKEIDADFVDVHYSFFRPWELDAIISVKQMGEAFLEKYFGALDHAKIARYQQFSEAFFMKHFSQMDASIVLEYGKNEWRKKENRSRQLDVFLRLKGVKI